MPNAKRFIKSGRTANAAIKIFSQRGEIGSPDGAIHIAEAQKSETAKDSQKPKRSKGATIDANHIAKPPAKAAASATAMCAPNFNSS